ncbi:MAG TPA: Rieske 2Fe-2S domain-containing protein [Sphingobacteriaceae bacterium]
MKRDEFLTTFGIGLAAVCTGCLASCSKGDDPEPNKPPGGTPPPPPPSKTINLNSEIQNVGDSKVVDGVLVVRLATGNVPDSFTAVQLACTHEGTSIAYNTTQGKFICPNHGSQFSTSGSVLVGPASTSLKKYTISISGTTLTITG